MPYRRSAAVQARLDAVREDVVAAGARLLSRGGYAALSAAAVASEAGVSTGALYRQVPGGMPELAATLFREASAREVAAVEAAAGARPAAPAVDRLEDAVRAFADRALRGRSLAYALLAEPADPSVDAERLVFRRAYRDVFAWLLAEAWERPSTDPDVLVTAAALVGAVGEALVGPLSPDLPMQELTSVDLHPRQLLQGEDSVLQGEDVVEPLVALVRRAAARPTRTPEVPA